MSRHAHPFRAALVGWIVNPLTIACLWLGERAYRGVIALRRWAYADDCPF